MYILLLWYNKNINIYILRKKEHFEGLTQGRWGHCFTSLYSQTSCLISSFLPHETDLSLPSLSLCLWLAQSTCLNLAFHSLYNSYLPTSTPVLMLKDVCLNYEYELMSYENVCWQFWQGRWYETAFLHFSCGDKNVSIWMIEWKNFPQFQTIVRAIKPCCSKCGSQTNNIGDTWECLGNANIAACSRTTELKQGLDLNKILVIPMSFKILEALL